MHEKGGLGYDKIAHPISENNITAGSVVAVLVGGTALYFCVILPFLSGSELIKALIYQNTALQRGEAVMFEKSLDSYKKAIGYNSLGTSEAREQLNTGMLNVVFQSTAPDEIKAEFAKYALEQMEKQVNETPNDARYHMFYGTALYNLSKVVPTVSSDQALSEMKRAVELSPNKPSMIIQLVAMLLNDKQYEEAVKYAKFAYELETENRDALSAYITALIYAGDNVLADKLYAELKVNTEKNRLLNNERNILRAYYETNQRAKIAVVLQEMKDLAKWYVEQKRWKDATNQINEILSVEPGWKAQADLLLAQIEEGMK